MCREGNDGVTGQTQLRWRLAAGPEERRHRANSNDTVRLKRGLPFAAQQLFRRFTRFNFLRLSKNAFQLGLNVPLNRPGELFGADSLAPSF